MKEIQEIKTELSLVTDTIHKLKHSEELAHSPIGASGMYRWGECPGSVRLSEGIKSISSVYADEGTKAHDYLARLLLRQIHTSAVPKEDGMRDAVLYAYEVVRSQLTRKVNEPENRLWVEHSFDLSHIHPGCHGTADIVIYKPLIKTLIVSDYKHGQGILVEVHDQKRDVPNPQLMYYALGALTTLEEIGAVDVVRLQVIQPRCEHPSGKYVRSWDTTPMELFDFAADLQEAAKATEDPNAPLVPGEHCRFCPAAAICPALHDKAHHLASKEFGVIVKKGEVNLKIPETKAQLSKALKWLPTLQSWIKSVNEYSYAEAMRGNIPTGFKLVEKRASRKWVHESQTALFLKQSGFKDSDVFEPKKMRSPAQLEKILSLNKLEKAQLSENHVIKKSSGLKLVSETEKGESISPQALAAKEFKQITNEENNE